MLPYPCFYYNSYLLSRTTHLLLDREKRIIGVLAGQPNGASWEHACNNAFWVLDKLAERVKPSKKDLESRHGIFPCIAYGISLGNGQTVSTTLVLFSLCLVPAN